MLRVDARPHKLTPPTPYLPAGRVSKIKIRGAKKIYYMFGGRPLLRRSPAPAAHNHPMCYENMLRGQRWTYGPRTRYVTYPPAGRQQENSQAEHPSPFNFDRTYSHHRKQIRPLGGLPPTWGSPLLPPAPMPIPRGEGASSIPRRERIGGAGAEALTADGLLLCSVALSVANLRASTRCR
jgi:hypothetical protein